MKYQVRKLLITAIMFGVVFAFVPKTSVRAEDKVDITRDLIGRIYDSESRSEGGLSVLEVRGDIITIKIQGNYGGTSDYNYYVKGDGLNETVLFIDCSFDNGCAVEIDKGVTIRKVTSSLDSGGVLGVNYGTIIECTNVGVLNNQGTIITNGTDAKISMNEGAGLVRNNNGTVESNCATVENNNGTIEKNDNQPRFGEGKVENNNPGAKVITNKGTVENNSSGAEVTTNTSKILCNEGTVVTNDASGIVKENKSGAKVITNNGKISSNEGTVTTNESTGKVYSNTGTVITNNGFETSDPESELDREERKEEKEESPKEEKKAKKDDDKPTPTENQAQQEAIYSSVESQIQSIVSMPTDSNSGTQSSRMVTIEGGEKIYSLPQKTMAMIAANPNITITFTYIYNGVKYMTVIPAGAVIDPTIEWFGPAYLMCHFPTAWVQPGNELVQVVAPVK